MDIDHARIKPMKVYVSIKYGSSKNGYLLIYALRQFLKIFKIACYMYCVPYVNEREQI